MIEEIKKAIPTDKYEKALKIAETSKKIALSYGYNEKQIEECYIVGLLYDAREFFHYINFLDLPMIIIEAIGLLHYERHDLYLHNTLRILESKNPYVKIVRAAELEVVKNEMD